MNTNIALLSLVLAFSACNRAEKKQDTTTAPTSVSVPAAAKPRNCQSVLDPATLGKANVYQESAKSINVTLTMNADTSITTTPNGCYTDNVVTILTTKKSGDRIFERTFGKDDLRYFGPSDETLAQTVLQNVTYKPTFNGQKYITLTVRLQEPVSAKKTDYLVYMNYFGEVVKVK